jgi:hypothetical protein
MEIEKILCNHSLIYLSIHFQYTDMFQPVIDYLKGNIWFQHVQP